MINPLSFWFNLKTIILHFPIWSYMSAKSTLYMYVPQWC
jgi:hypothetical protein